MSKQQSLKVGDRVTWKSQSRGHETTKTGMVIAVIPPGGDSIGYWMKVRSDDDRVQFVNGERDHASYLVRCAPQGEDAKITRVYWPLVQYITRKTLRRSA